MKTWLLISAACDIIITVRTTQLVRTDSFPGTGQLLKYIAFPPNSSFEAETQPVVKRPNLSFEDSSR